VPIVDYNSQIAEVTGYRTLLQLRTAMMRRLGFSTQVSVPPAGMSELLTEFLQSAQRALFIRPEIARQERIYTWTLVDGQQFYGLTTNEEAGTGANKPMSATKVRWVGIERDNNWYPLISGIPPELYGTPNVGGFPTHYQINQSIEIYPVPDATVQYLRIKGAYGLLPFEDDTDTPTIDDELVLLMALYLAKLHYGQPDANTQLQIMEVMLGGLVAGTHQTNRYVYSGGKQLEPFVEPVPTVPFAP
jgi:hypothetical protein